MSKKKLIGACMTVLAVSGCNNWPGEKPATQPAVAPAKSEATSSAKPAEATPAKQAEKPQPAETAKPAETKVPEPKPTVETKAPEAKPQEAKPAEVKSPEVKPADPAKSTGDTAKSTGAAMSGSGPVAMSDSSAKSSDSSSAGKAAKSSSAVAVVRPSLAAATQPSLNMVMGTVTFSTLENGKVRVVAQIKGLSPNAKHGFHIHEKGDVSSADLASAGGHFNPGKHQHGGPTTAPAHEGDLGNLETNDKGEANYEFISDMISVGTGKDNDVLGRSVIVHAKTDDLKTQPSGASGARIAGGVIEAK